MLGTPGELLREDFRRHFALAPTAAIVGVTPGLGALSGRRNWQSSQFRTAPNLSGQALNAVCHIGLWLHRRSPLQALTLPPSS